MSADLQVEEPPRRLNSFTGTAGARESHVWDRAFGPWDLYFGVVWAATVAFVLGADFPALSYRLPAAALLTLLIPWYAWAGRPLLLRDPGAEPALSLRYLGVLTALFLPAAFLVGETRLITFAIAPHCFMLLPLRRAIGAMAVVSLLPVAGWALLWRPEGHVVFMNAVGSFVTLAFSSFFGAWILRIIGQSQERASLITELDASREEVARLSAAQGAHAERERMSREIHDTLAQGFTSLLMLVQAVQSELDTDPEQAHRHLELMAATARQNLAEARALVAGGAPADLDAGSLPDAVRRLAARQDPPADVSVTGEVRPLAAALEVVALRSCQESLANAAKHAGAGARCSVSLAYGDDGLTVAVRDTGRGFDPAAPVPGYGLRGLRARAAEVGGTAAVEAAPGCGTTVTVTLPTTTLPISPTTP
ncbi:sensor histidine kinase [Streptomyces flavotricini]|uniref:histidine kinase n=1 Tax=Streptomyces flavotricini TaxID=66888 RepID=A0ABS8EDP8_9ACTN|nr:sensor histidine kinase [Streptomyces flavotricini]MCC0099196.1 sensor histidine kinase [Streptomyces flavotricini]